MLVFARIVHTIIMIPALPGFSLNVLYIFWRSDRMNPPSIIYHNDRDTAVRGHITTATLGSEYMTRIGDFLKALNLA